MNQNSDLNDFSPARETVVPKDSNARIEDETIFAVCLQTDDETLLVPLKVYEIKLRGKYARVIDEAGEAAVYPLNFFLPLKLPQEAFETLSQIHAQAA